MILCHRCGYKYEECSRHVCYSRREGPVSAGKNKSEKYIVKYEVKLEKNETEKKSDKKNSVGV